MFFQKYFRRCPMAPILVFIFLFISLDLFSQNVNVNTLTGTANVTIPIYNVRVGSISAPVALAYASTGLKVDNYKSQFGVGWDLITGGSITRELRGFPDDIEYQGNSSYPSIKGWIVGGIASTVQSFSIANTSPTNCPDEITDASNLDGTFADNYDTEPDVFHVSAPGLSFSFVFDGSSTTKINVIPYADVIVTPSYDTYNRLESFTVLNDKGIKYTFAKKVIIQHYIDNSGGALPSSLEVFRRNFVYFREDSPSAGLLAYYDEWGLTEMEDPIQGDKILFSYNIQDYYNNIPVFQYNQNSVEILVPDKGGFVKKSLYTVQLNRGVLKPNTITTSVNSDGVITVNTEVQFGWGGTNAESKLTGIELTKEKLHYWCEYKSYTNSSWSNWTWDFLKTLKTSRTYCESEQTRYDFSYYDVDFAANTCYCISTASDSIRNGQDYWGYFNGNVTNPDLQPALWAYPDLLSHVETYKINSIPSYSGTEVAITSASDRSVKTVSSSGNDPSSGTLKRITYPSGAATEFEYENNDYFDKDVNDIVLGGGIRLKKMTSNDGLNTVEETNYTYTDASNVSTGKALSVPKFAIPFQSHGVYSSISDEIYGHTYLSEKDLNSESEEIIYGKVTVQKNNAGKTVYEYNVSGTFGDASITNWDETMHYVSRNNLNPLDPCVDIQPYVLRNGKLQYPFAPNTNFDFERGLLEKVSHYNESGDLVASEENRYGLSNTTPDYLYGLKIDQIGNDMVAYARYTINTNIDNFLTSKTSTVYNSTSPTNTVYTQQIQDFTYGSAYHKLLTETSTQNSDGATMINRFQYVKDYPTATGTGDNMDDAMYNLKLLNNNALVESSQSRLQGGTEKTIGASLTTYHWFARDPSLGGNMYMPWETYKFVSQDGVTNFSFSDITSGTFSKNSNYTNAPTKVIQYNYSGVPMLVNNSKNIPVTVITYNLRELITAQFTNAMPDAVAFSNFELDNTSFNFSGTNASLAAGGRYSNYYLNFQTNTSLTKTITNNGDISKNIILSCWVKDVTPATSPAITISMGGSTYTIVPTASVSKWTYYQLRIPNPSVSSYPTYSITLTSNTPLKLDDLLVYPDNASVMTNSYNNSSIGNFLLTAQTGLNGTCKYYEYDYAGRLWLVRDQFENILEMKKFLLPNKWAAALAAYISIGPNPAVENTSVTLAASLTGQTTLCPVGTNSYLWDFGDGSSTVTTTTATVNHTYTTHGTYRATVTILVPGYGSVTGQTAPTTNTSPDPLPITITTGGGGSPTPGGGGTPVICAAGIIQRTSSGTCIQSTCSPLTGSCSETKFMITSITGGSMSNINSVEWQEADYGGTNWTYWSIGAGYGWQTSHPFHVVHTPSYSMRAKITYNDYSVAYSNTISVLNGD